MTGQDSMGGEDEAKHLAGFGAILFSDDVFGC